MDFSYQRIIKSDTAVIGVEGVGAIETSQDWVQSLWFSLEEQLPAVIEKLAVSETDVACWGVMSDAKEWLAPWTEGQGLYLAGIEVPLETPCPRGWSRYLLPAMEYIVIRTTIPLISEAVSYLFETIVPKEAVEIIGALQEFYGADFLPGEIALYAPIRIIEL